MFFSKITGSFLPERNKLSSLEHPAIYFIHNNIPLQLNFNLSSQVRDSLLRNAPAPATPEDPGTRPTGTMGTLVLDQHRSTALGEHEVFPSCPQGRVAILSSLSSFLLRQCYNDRVTRENSVPCTRSLARPLSG